MSHVFSPLSQLLELEPLEKNLFRGASLDLGYPQLYGGQLLGQALSAASQTVASDRNTHSLHGYFLRTGNANLPVIYQVEHAHDGGSFSARRVTAIQNGQIIFSSIVSFHLSEEGFEHQMRMPSVPGPENLPTKVDLIRKWAHKVPKSIQQRLAIHELIEVRPVGLQNPIDQRLQEPYQNLWLRASDRLPDTPAVHRNILAYASDIFLIATALLPHDVSLWQQDIKIASLDHALWFHRHFRADEWLLYSMESPWSSHGRGLARGYFFTQDGQLIATVVQEGLIRKRRK